MSEAAAATAGSGRELFVRHARRDGRSVVILKAIDYGSSCVVEAEVYATAGGAVTRPGPYVFSDAVEATAFATDAVESLMYLGCEVTAE